MNGVILLIAKSNTCLIFANSFVLQSFQKVGSFVYNFVLDIWIVFIFKLELVGWELLDGKVGAADGALVGKDIGSFSRSSVEDVINIGVCKDILQSY